MQIGTYVKIIQTIFSKPITITHYLGCFVITAMIFELLVVMAIVFIVTKKSKKAYQNTEEKTKFP